MRGFVSLPPYVLCCGRWIDRVVWKWVACRLITGLTPLVEADRMSESPQNLVMVYLRRLDIVAA